LAVGYRANLSAFSTYLDVDERGFPMLQQYQSTKNKQLFCIGYDYPATEAWLQAIQRSSKEVVQDIAKCFKGLN